jgi:serine/threonine protein kinase
MATINNNNNNNSPLPPINTNTTTNNTNINTSSSSTTLNNINSNLTIADTLRSHGYVLGPQIGKGSFGIVYKCREITTNTEMAVKVLDLSVLRLRQEESRIVREVGVMQQLKHPNIVRLIDFIQTSDLLCLIMELVDGVDLFDTIVVLKGFDEDSARFVFYQICSALGYMHYKGILHRDIKPENILLERCKSSERSVQSGRIPPDTTIKLVDFGLSKSGAEEQQMSFAGTPLYIAPEIMLLGEMQRRKRLNGDDGVLSRPFRGYSTPADCYSAGMVLFVMIVGAFPLFDSEGRIKFDGKASRVSQLARDLILGLTHPDPERRVSMVGALKHEWMRPIVQAMQEEDSRVAEMMNDNNAQRMATFRAFQREINTTAAQTAAAAAAAAAANNNTGTNINSGAGAGGGNNYMTYNNSANNSELDYDDYEDMEVQQQQPQQQQPMIQTQFRPTQYPYHQQQQQLQPSPRTMQRMLPPITQQQQPTTAFHHQPYNSLRPSPLQFAQQLQQQQQQQPQQIQMNTTTNPFLQATNNAIHGPSPPTTRRGLPPPPPSPPQMVGITVGGGPSPSNSRIPLSIPFRTSFFPHINVQGNNNNTTSTVPTNNNTNNNNQFPGIPRRNSSATLLMGLGGNATSGVPAAPPPPTTTTTTTTSTNPNNNNNTTNPTPAVLSGFPFSTLAAAAAKSHPADPVRGSMNSDLLHFNPERLSLLQSHMDSAFQSSYELAPPEMFQHVREIHNCARELLSEAQKTIINLGHTAVSALDVLPDTRLSAEEGEPDVVSMNLDSLKSWTETLADKTRKLLEENKQIVWGVSQLINAACEYGAEATTQQLLKVERLLENHGSFWDSIDINIQHLLQKTIHIGGMISLIRNPRLKDRFVQRITEYTASWRQIMIRCSTPVLRNNLALSWPQREQFGGGGATPGSLFSSGGPNATTTTTTTGGIYFGRGDGGTTNNNSSNNTTPSDGLGGGGGGGTTTSTDNTSPRSSGLAGVFSMPSSTASTGTDLAPLFVTKVKLL